MDDQDTLLRELARTAQDEMSRERNRLDERWDRLSAGTLTVEEEAELRALAATSEEAREAWEAFRPLGSGFQDRIVQAIQPIQADRAPAAKVLPFSRRLARQGGWLAAAAAVAAVLLLTLRQPAALPAYHAELSGGDRQERAETGSRRFAPGSPFVLVLRPQTTVEGEVDVRFFLEGKGELRPWPVSAEVAPGGAVRVAGALGREIPIAPGDWTVWAVVGRRGDLPDAAALRARLAAGEPRSAHWTALPTPLHIEQNP
jgi:hypothetical protein